MQTVFEHCDGLYSYGIFSQQKPFFGQQKGQKRATISVIKCPKSHDFKLCVFLAKWMFVIDYQVVTEKSLYHIVTLSLFAVLIE